MVAAALVVATTTGLAVGAAESSRKTPEQWLEAMDAAFRDLDYDGVFSYYTANRAQQAALATSERSASGRALGFSGFGVGNRTAAQLATFRVVHKVVDGVNRERVVHLNGPPREILRTGEQVTCVLLPGDSLLDFEGALASGPYARVFNRHFEDMNENYDVAFDGRGRIAARPAVRLSVTPKDHDRLGYRLALDEDTGLLLSSELHDSEGANLEIFQFTSLRVGDDVALADLEPATSGAVLHHLSPPEKTRKQAAADADDAPGEASHWRVRWVPSGFRMTSARGTVQAEGTVSTLVFSDGLAAFSVFIEDLPRGGAGSVVSRRGATVVLTHLASSGGGEHLVTVVGEVPVATARRVAAGVSPRP